MLKRVLIIAYYFPPVGGGGVQRTAKFVKYLPEFGWEPIVLTVKEEIYRKTNRVIDLTLLDNISDNVHVVRTNSIDLARASSELKAQKETKTSWKSTKSLINKVSGLFINPDAQMLWIPVAVREGLKLIKKYNINVIYSTGNPWSDHIVGATLSKISGLPFVADYRDAWNPNPCITHTTKIRKNIQLFLERKVIKYASRVIFTSDGTKNDYEKAFGNSKFVTIWNAFDPSDFTSVKAKKFPKFTFLYAGNIPGYFKRPSGLVYAIAKWLEKHPEVREKIMINFLGKKDEKIKLIAEENHLLDVINFLGYKPHKESIAFQLGADVLFLALEEDIGKTAIPGKLFEYLACGKPILALIPPEGAAANIMKREGREEFIVSPEDTEGIAEKIEILYMLYKQENLPSYRTDNLDKYSRKELTAAFATILNGVGSYS